MSDTRPVDRATGLPAFGWAPLDDGHRADRGVVYLQLGRFTSVEPLYGADVYDRILALAGVSLRAATAGSTLAPAIRSVQFNGADGFYVVYEVAAAEALAREADALREHVVAHLRDELGSTAAGLVTIHATSVVVPDDPRVQPARNLVRGMHEAARLVGARQRRDHQTLVQQLGRLIADQGLRAVYQPVVDIHSRRVLGYEALIRGPVGSALEMPNQLFAAAREGGVLLELESLCLDRVFSAVPEPVRDTKLFVNASCRLLQHAVFLDPRNLEFIQAAHPHVVVEVSEKEVVRDYAAFRSVLGHLRASGMQIAIDDAGSGYSGLESILQMRPEYIKVADSIVGGLHRDPVKRQIVTALATLGRQIDASIVAEGIEEDADLASLLDLGVDYGQGFLLGRPSAEIAAA